jgi:hypothetical protein
MPFYYGVRKHLSAVPWVSLTWRPVLSSMLTGALLWMLRDVTFIVLIPLSLAVYAGCLVITGTFTAEDIALLKRLLPGRVRRGVQAPDMRP